MIYTCYEWYFTCVPDHHLEALPHLYLRISLLFLVIPYEAIVLFFTNLVILVVPGASFQMNTSIPSGLLLKNIDGSTMSCWAINLNKCSTLSDFLTLKVYNGVLNLFEKKSSLLIVSRILSASEYSCFVPGSCLSYDSFRKEFIAEFVASWSFSAKLGRRNHPSYVV